MSTSSVPTLMQRIAASAKQASKTKRRALVIVLLVSSLFLPAAVAIGAFDSQGGPWIHTQGPIVCQFKGRHFNVSGAVGRTEDHNLGCADLGVRLKYLISGNPQATNWVYSTPQAPDIWQVFGPANTTALSSEHQAMNGWNGTWSSVQRPHAW